MDDNTAVALGGGKGTLAYIESTRPISTAVTDFPFVFWCLTPDSLEQLQSDALTSALLLTTTASRLMLVISSDYGELLNAELNVNHVYGIKRWRPAYWLRQCFSSERIFYPPGYNAYYKISI